GVEREFCGAVGVGVCDPRRRVAQSTRPRSEDAMVQTDTLTALFHDLVQEAMEHQHIASSETTECYLVHLMERSAAPGRPDLLDPPLGVDYLRAFELPAAQRFDRLRRVADTALFITGMFVDCLDRGLVGADYYTALDRNAYAHLSN